MAEGVTIESQSRNLTRYFCHCCRRDVSAVTSELICPECSSSFLEEVSINPRETSGFEQLLNLLEFERAQEIPTSLVERRRPLTIELDDDDSAESEIDIESELTAEDDVIEMNRRLNIPYPLRQNEDNLTFLHSLVASELLGISHLDEEFNSDDDIDDVASQLLDEIEISGPPPLTKNQIKALPIHTFTAENTAKDEQCTICMDDFNIGARAKKLTCEHLFHERCITPWLEKQASCPNCRVTVQIEAPSRPLDLSTRRNSMGRRLSENFRNPFRFL